jgi:hypothetical protein
MADTALARPMRGIPRAEEKPELYVELVNQAARLRNALVPHIGKEAADAAIYRLTLETEALTALLERTNRLPPMLRERGLIT